MTPRCAVVHVPRLDYGILSVSSHSFMPCICMSLLAYVLSTSKRPCTSLTCAQPLRLDGVDGTTVPSSSCPMGYCHSSMVALTRLTSWPSEMSFGSAFRQACHPTSLGFPFGNAWHYTKFFESIGIFVLFNLLVPVFHSQWTPTDAEAREDALTSCLELRVLFQTTSL